MDEFGLIAKHFKPLTLGNDGALQLLDDAAIIDVPEGHSLVMTKDAISHGVHFIGNESPGIIARKLLRVNLSDLAAMGAEPIGLLLAVMLPKFAEEEWIEQLAEGIAEDQKEFRVPLLGGDTIATLEKGFSASLTAIGIVPKGKFISRSGANPGDDIYVSGTVGDGVLGLHLLQDRLSQSLPKNHADFLTKRYQLPTPRLSLGKALRDIATSCIDVSDGLSQDVGHLCQSGKIGATIMIENLPMSEAATYIVNQDMSYITSLISEGDDYELIFTAPPHLSDKIDNLSRELKVRITKIGSMTARPGVNVVGLNGEDLMVGAGGYRHFA